MSLRELVRAFGGECDLAAGEGPSIVDVKLDSRSIERGDLFAALAGERTDGARFAPQAIANGALAVLANQRIDALAVPQWLHRDARSVAGRVAALLNGEPARGMYVAAVTGTNGKTTTAHLAGQLLEAAGRKPAILGTAGNRLADGAWVPASHTTPDAPGLQRLVARHRALGGDALVLEASSHALEQERLAGLPISAAVFTNLSRDHLDYHGSMERYAAAKAKLFDALEPGSVAVVCETDAEAPRMAERAKRRGARVIGYAVEPSGSTVEQSAGAEDRLRASDVRTDLEGTSLTLNGMGFHGVGIRLPLLGRFNVENALAASVVALSSGAGPSAVVEGLAAVLAPPGRLERVPSGGRRLHVFVDYAHTEDALRRVLGLLREALGQRGGRLAVVFGCGGERDPGKRAGMGRAATELADLAVLTSDNPRGEDPEAILDAIEAGCTEAERAGGRARVLRESDRRAAIRAAIRTAGRGDVVLIAGKGHERTQEIAGRMLPFDDCRVAAEELAA